MQGHQRAEDFQFDRIAVAAPRHALVACPGRAPRQPLQRLGAGHLVGRPDEHAPEGKARGQLGLGIAQDFRHPGIGMDEAQVLVGHVDARDRVVRQAVEHGLGLGQRRVLSFDVPQQLLDVRRGIVQHPAQFAQFVAGRQRRAGGVVARRQGPALFHQVADGPQDPAEDHPAGQGQQDEVQREQGIGAVEGPLLDRPGLDDQAVHERLGMRQQIRAGPRQVRHGVPVSGRRPGQRVDGDAIAHPGQADGAQLRREHFRHGGDVQAERVAAAAQRVVRRLEQGRQIRLVGIRQVRMLVGHQGFQADALAEHAHLARDVQRGGHTIAFPQQELDDGHVADGQQHDQDEGQRGLLPQGAREGVESQEGPGNVGVGNQGTAA